MMSERARLSDAKLRLSLIAARYLQGERVAAAEVDAAVREHAAALEALRAALEAA